MKAIWTVGLLLTSACAELRIERDAELRDYADDPSEHGAAPAESASQPARVPRSCDAGEQLIVQEAFTKNAWPQAWLATDGGHSWVESGAGFLAADPAASHGRALYAAFGDIDVAVRWVPSPEQQFHLVLRGDVENKPATTVEGHAVGSPRAQWLRARVWNGLGTTRLEVHEWFDGEAEPEGWLRSNVESAGPVGTFSLLAQEDGGATPVRIEEVLICTLVVGTDA